MAKEVRAAPVAGLKLGKRATVYIGDALTVLRQVPARSVHCVVTSPPYYALRDYGVSTWEGGNQKCKHSAGHQAGLEDEYPSSNPAGVVAVASQVCSKCGAVRRGLSLGMEPEPDCLGWATGQKCGCCYICHLVLVLREVRWTLRDDGVMWLVLGDTYAADRTEQAIETKWKNNKQNTRGMRVPDGLKPKDLVGIPWRAALALQADGWTLRSDNIWHKPNAMPSSVTDRTTPSHEHVFMLTKSQAYFYDNVAVMEPAKEWTGQAATFKRDDGKATKLKVPGQAKVSHRPDRKQDAVGKRQYTGFNARWDAVHGKGGINAFRGQGSNRPEGKGRSNRDGREMRDVGRGPTRNRRDVWTIPTSAYKGSHFAVFPPALVEVCLKASTSERGCCPTCGQPWVRVTKKAKTFHSGSGKSGNPIHGKNGPKLQGGGDTGDIRKGPVVDIQTTGWQPRCEHGHSPIPMTILDPFVGSGTTLMVAERLGLASIGIELNKKDLRLIKQRIKEKK